MLALCRTVGELGGFFAPHHRSYGKGALEAYAEMIDLTPRAGCALHLSHATMNFAPNKGRAGELLALLDAADRRRRGHHPGHLPLPARRHHALGDPAQLGVGRRHGADAAIACADPATRCERIREDLEVNGSDGCHGVVAEWDTLEISGVQNPELDELRRARPSRSIAADREREPFDVFVDILIRDELGTGILQHVGHEENVQAIMRHPRHTGGSDGLLVGAKPHPRAWGTFPRYLGHYCRDLGLLTLEECVGHLSGRAAARLRLADRGLVRDGYAADLVLFDPDTVRDTATYDEPAPGRRRHPLRVRQRRGSPSTTASPPAPAPAAPCAAAATESPEKEQPMTPEQFVRQLEADRALAVVRAESIPDAAELCRALADGGIRTVELTFTTPDVLTTSGARRTRPRARRRRRRRHGDDRATRPAAAIDAGAQFLVTPGLRPEVAEVAAGAGDPVLPGRHDPHRGGQALDLGSAAVKIFPARRLGPEVPDGPARPLPGHPAAALRGHRRLQRQRATSTPVPPPSAAAPAWSRRAAVAAGNWADIAGTCRRLHRRPQVAHSPEKDTSMR